MPDVLGPASLGAVTTRPDRTIVRGSSNTWFKDCDEGDPNSGTVIPADYFNDLLAQVRTVLTSAGIVLDNGDDMLWRALQTLGVRYGADGGTKNHIVATLSPALTAYTAGMLALVKIGNSNDGATDVNFNGLGVKSLVGYGGAALGDGDLVAGDLALIAYDGSKCQLLQSGGWNAQAVGAGLARNLAASATGLTASVSASADELVVANAQNRYRTLRSINVTVNSASVGANGLDSGTLAANTWYALWVIWNGTAAAGLLSLSATAPTLPAGYTHKARVGWIRTDGTVNKYPLAFVQFGRDVAYRVKAGSNVAAMPAMVIGNAPTWTPIGVDPFVPPTAQKIKVMLGSYQGSWTAAAPNGDYSNDLVAAHFNAPLMGYINVAWGQVNIPAEFVLESRYLYYSGGADNSWATNASAMMCLGWTDSL